MIPSLSFMLSFSSSNLSFPTSIEAVLAARAEVEAVLPEKIVGVVPEVDPPEEAAGEEEEMIVEGDELRVHPKQSPLK